MTDEVLFKNYIIPEIPRGKNFLIWLSHDVDRVQKTIFHSIYYFFKERKFSHLQDIFSKNNPYWNFDRIMALEGQYNAKSTFFFLNETMKADILQPKSYILAKGRYDITSPKIKQIIKAIDKNGWEVGLHGSYQSFLDKELLTREKRTLEEVIGHEIGGIRQHYWNNVIPKTWAIQRSIGLKYDATFATKDDIGFRENIYYPFRPFDDDFLVIPTVIMEYYLFNKADGNVDVAKKMINDLIDFCKNKRAVFSVLWHPHFINPKEFPDLYNLYEYLLKRASEEGGYFITPKNLLSSERVKWK